MSDPTAKFLTELLEEAQRAVEVIEILLAGDKSLTLQQRNGLIHMQAAYERLCDQLRETLREHDFTEEVPELGHSSRPPAPAKEPDEGGT